MRLNDRINKQERKAGERGGCLVCRGAVKIKDIFEGEDPSPHRCPECWLKGMGVIGCLNKAKK